MEEENKKKRLLMMSIVDEKYCYEEETSLTVHKTSVFFAGDGFIVYNHEGQLLFRFDSYGPDSKPMDELVLMDASGNCLLTLHRKKPSLHQRWEGYLGEKKENQNPLFRTHRSSIIGRSEVVVEINGCDGDEEYEIKGSYSRRNCAVYKSIQDDSSREPKAEIKRKVDPSTNVTLGKDVFALVVKAGFDCAFAMGLVLILDQMYGNDESSDDDDGIGESRENDSPKMVPIIEKILS